MNPIKTRREHLENGSTFYQVGSFPELGSSSEKALKSTFEKAKDLLCGDGEESLDEVIQKIEKRYQSLPNASETLANIIVFSSAVRDHLEGRYVSFSVPAIISVAGTCLYFAYPDKFDRVVYSITNDEAVIKECLKKAGGEIEEYKQWLSAN